ncbi:MAG: hypothetical protein L6Q54_03130 [Leptospiraceae bacterium]|nr:hypothetical protein [Leptospiraceae bacterium]MCK6380230.1 hypothetical protein [Leptospiraceae bacterium]NUM42521.1 hypothetical protein [Leptospiraceae bacterium]
MEHDGKYFFTNRVGQIYKFGEFLGNLDYLRLEDEIKDEEGRVLVQAKRPLKDTILQSLINRGLDEKLTLRFENTEYFESHLISMVISKSDKLLGLNSYSFPAHLLKSTEVDMDRVIRSALKNKFFLGFMILTMFNESAVLDHLFEVTLTSIGLYATQKKDNLTYSELIHLFQAGMLHDYTTMNSVKWEEEEIFGGESNHDALSASEIDRKEIAKEVSKIIDGHNRIELRYLNADKRDNWYSDPVELSRIILKLVEYFNFQKRLLANEESSTEKVMYDISLQAQKGYFPNPVIKGFVGFFNKYTEFFTYGSDIGKVENKCPHGKFALAYPKPKSTQVVCKNPEIPCKHRLASQPIKVVAIENEKHKSRLGDHLEPGWYEKCAFSNDLPIPPNDI